MLSATSPAVVAFVHAFEENQNVAGHPVKVIAEDRRKYIAIDEVDKGATPPYHYPHISHRGGRFLIDRKDGTVYSIKSAYGKAGYRLGTVTMMALRYREASRTYDPSSRLHVEIGHAKVATTAPDELRAAFRTHGQGRRRPTPARRPKKATVQRRERTHSHPAHPYSHPVTRKHRRRK